MKSGPTSHSAPFSLSVCCDDDNEGGDYHHGGHSAPVYVVVNIHPDVLVKARCHDHVKRLLYLKNRNSLVALF